MAELEQFHLLPLVFLCKNKRYSVDCCTNTSHSGWMLVLRFHHYWVSIKNLYSGSQIVIFGRDM